MEWKKSPPEIEEVFGMLFPMGPDIDQFRMYGIPVWLIGCNIIAGLYEDRLFVRLSSEDLEYYKINEQAELVAPFTTCTKKEYILVPDHIIDDWGLLKILLMKSIGYVQTIEPIYSKS